MASNGSTPPAAASNGSNLDCPPCPPHLRRITPEDETRERALLSREDILLALADAKGVDPPEELGLLVAFDRQVARLPPERKAALHRGYTAEQARLFLRIEGGDAARAADRMAQYWERRAAVLGPDAFSSTRLGRTEDDFRRMYKMALGALVDAEVDNETRRWAEHFSSTYTETKLAQLEGELRIIPTRSKVGLARAQELRPEVALSHEYGLPFLRSENFNALRAAWRMVKYWDLRFQLLGNDEGDVFRSISANDLMEEFPRELMSGWARRIPGSDASGRGLILISSHRFPEQISVQGMLKVIWYVLHSMLEDEHCCINGIVMICNHKGLRSSTINWEFITQVSRLFLESMPLSIKAVHECTPKASIFLNILAPVVKWIVGGRFRLRYCIHAGSDEEILHELDKFGISLDLVPMELGGALDLDSAFDAWIEEMDAARA